MIVGKHVYGSLYNIGEKRAFEDERYLEKVVRRAVEAAHATLHDIRSWKIEGEKGGISVIALVLESHIAIHTWREYNYATVDIYTCGEHTDPWQAWEVIFGALKPEKVTVHFADRSQLF